MKMVLKMESINKSFHGNVVLKNINLEVKAGEVRALVGENGAGKSTLMKILSGIYQADSGNIYIEGEKKDIISPKAAIDLKISLIHQEISLVESLTTYENIFLGVEHKKARIFNDDTVMKNKAQEMLDELQLNFNANTKVESLNVAQKQMVEVAKALCFESKIIIFDEPTASLSDSEAESLFKQINLLKEKGLAVIYISHRLEEIMDIADTVTVLRDGELIDTKAIVDITRNDIVTMMVGREIKDLYIQNRPAGQDVVLSVQELNTKKVRNVNLELKRGEILGISGLVGAGRTELANAIFGVDRVISGDIMINGKKVKINTPMDAIRNNIALIPEDRKVNGLILEKDIGFNLTLLVLKEFIKGIKIDKRKEKEIINNYSKSLSIKMSSHHEICLNLSGGNQQKVVISKWLASNPKIIILDEPTRGVDIGAKREIYHLINKLNQTGISIILISSELPEILNLSSRIAVMHEGEMKKIIEINDSDNIKELQEKVMHFATGGE